MSSIIKDYSRDSLFDPLGLMRLRDSYMRDDENSPQDRFAFVSEQFGSNPEHAQRLYGYSSKHWLSYSTPILSFGRTASSQAISCYLNYIHDSASGLVDNLSETNWLSMLGGGVGVHVGIRSSDSKSTGVMSHLKTYDSASRAYRQGKCYIAGTEILTRDGWKVLESLNTYDTVASVDDSGKVIWCSPSELVEEDYAGKLINFVNVNRGIDFTVTEDHSMVIERKSRKLGWKGELIKVRASDVPIHNEARFILSSINTNLSICELTPIERLNIAFQADGHKCKKIQNATEFHFSKERKIKRLESILIDSGIKYTKSALSSEGTTRFYIPEYSGNKDFSDIDLTSLSPSKANSILEEIAEWDGYRNREHSFIYSNINKKAADFVQCLAVLAGRSSRLSELERSETRQILYTVFIGNKPYFNLEKLIKKEINYSGKVYCCVVPSGKIIVRNGAVPLICGNTRRGSYAAYLDISHPDIIQFLEMRKPTGDPDLRCLNMNHGVNIPDKFYEIIERCMYDDTANDDWELIQPNTGEVVEIVSAKALWALILDIRLNTGEPYIWNIDAANRALPQYQKDLGLKIHGSNLCSEISLATSEERTAVCCLSSVNAEYYDEWKDDPNFIPDVLEMLDNVLTHFIDNAPGEINRAKYSAFRERSVGVGVLGFHAYLQKNRIPFESALAKSFNIKLFKHIRTQLDAKNIELALERGSCPDAAEAGVTRRCTHVMAVAPNASTSIILGNTSPSTEPFASNVYIQDTISGAYVTKNKFLDALIKNSNVDYDETWASIIANRTVQHLEWMDPYDKLVFKTAREIDQQWLIEHAADRQPWIDQGQSLNIYVKPNVDTKYFHHLHYLIWKKNLKGAYYCRSGKMAAAEAVGQQVKRVRLEDEIANEDNTTDYSGGSFIHDGQAAIANNISTIELVEASGCLACE